MAAPRRPPDKAPDKAPDRASAGQGMNNMHGHDKARRFAGDDGAMAASIGELVAMSAFSAPCCSHVALCDGACRDARPGDDGPRRRLPGDPAR